MGFGDNFAGVQGGGSGSATQKSEKEAAPVKNTGWTIFDLANAQAVVTNIEAAGGVASGNDVNAIKVALAPLVGDDHACLLAQWSAGSPIESNQSVLDRRASAETTCGTRGLFGLGGESVTDALEHLRKIDHPLSAAISRMGVQAEAQNTAKFEQDAKEDADKIKDKIKRGAAITGGGTVVALAIAAGVYLWLKEKG